MKLWKYILISSLSLFLALEGTGQVRSKDWADLRRYAEDNRKLPPPQKGEKRVVFLGNSITENWYRMDPEFFNSNHYIGRGISGQTSYQFIVRFREDVINLKPDLVVINAGTNDIAENTGVYQADYTFGNILTLVELAKAHKIKVILTSVLPAAGFGWNKDIHDAPVKIKALNEQIRKYAGQNKIPYVDYYSRLKDEKDALDAKYTRDGVHPLIEGYKIMEIIVKPVIDKTLK